MIGVDEPDRSRWRRFALVFALLSVSLETFYFAILLDTDGFSGYLAGLAQFSGVLLNAVGQDVVVTATQIQGPRFAVEISEGCDAIQISSLLIAAMVAFPTTPLRRLRGVCLGLAWLQAANFVRIVSLYLIGVRVPEVFAIMHQMVWPSLMIALTIATWVVWALWETRREFES
jgi:exosortase/archaeosortase family protein